MLNQLGFYVFLPALAFSKLAQSVSFDDLATWWPLPLNVFIKCVRAASAARPAPLWQASLVDVLKLCRLCQRQHAHWCHLHIQSFVISSITYGAHVPP